MYIKQQYIEQLKNKVDFLTDLKEEVVYKWIKINKLSKSIIYALIRDDLESAKSYVNDIFGNIKEYQKIVAPYPIFRKSAEVSFQEFAEAIIFFIFLTQQRIPTHDELQIEVIPYLGWLMDFTGELSRKAVEKMIEWDLGFAKKAKHVIEEIYFKMLEMEFKNFELRKKVDYVAWVLNRLQDYIFYANLKASK